MFDEIKKYIKTIKTLSEVDVTSITQSQDSFLSNLDSKIQAYTAGLTVGGWNRILYRPFDGERNLGGLGPINNYFLDHESLRLRGWQLILESEVMQIAIQRYVVWLIGDGLRLSSEPDETVLNMFGRNLNTQKFSKELEALWNLWSNNPRSDKARLQSLHAIIYQAEINALVGGDCLIKIDIGDTGLPEVELIDGCHIGTPLLGSLGFDITNPNTGNRIRHGIEINKRGEHVAYYVRKGSGDGWDEGGTLDDFLNYERIEARDKKTGYVRCFMYYGLRYRQSDVRGIPIISVCMETAKQLERYKEATVDGAVQRAKVAIVAQHDLGAIGSNPFEAQMLKGAGGPFSDFPKDVQGKNIEDTVAARSNGEFINPMPGTKLTAIDSKQEIHFSEFFDTNLSIIFAAIGIPKEIALMLFGSNYSASRASIKDWEHTLKVKRKKNVAPAYDHVKNIFQLTQVLMNRISAPGYIEAVMERNDFVQMAYENAEWVGDNPPNIDELKEVTAARLKAGAGSAHLPFDTFEKIIRDLGITGDVRHIFDEYQNDMLYGDEIGIEKVEGRGQTVEDFDTSDEDKKGKPGTKGDKKKGKEVAKK